MCKMTASWRVLGKGQSVVCKALQLGHYALNLGITPWQQGLTQHEVGGETKSYAYVGGTEGILHILCSARATL
jgi:hypothetical protein